LDENEAEFTAWAQKHPWLALKFSEVELRRSIGVFSIFRDYYFCLLVVCIVFVSVDLCLFV
jgi:hypothetical protein